MKYILLILSIFTINILQAQTMRSVYDLDFQGFNKCNWDWEQCRRHCLLDITQAGLKVYAPKNSGNKMEFKFGKEIMFPISEIKNLEIKLFAKSKPYSPLIFKIIGIDKNEEIAFVKTTTFQKGDSVNAIKIDSKLRNLKSVKLLIKGESEKGQFSEFILKKVEIWLNERNYTDESIVETALSSATLLKDYIQPLYPFKPKLWNIYGKSDKAVKIIGLGENTHGSKTISETRLMFLKDLIVNDNCTLILTEFPSDVGLLIDLFIQGISNDTQLVEDYLKLGFDHTSKLSFLSWLREYNSKSDRKVHFVGIDIPKFGYFHPLLDFYYEVMDSTESKPYLDRINKAEFDEILQHTRQNTLLKEKIGHSSFQYLLYLVNEFKKRPAYKPEGRDSLMFIRSSYARKIFASKNEKTVILAHSAHLQKTKKLYFEELISPLGNLLARAYKKKYVSINFNFGYGAHVQDSCSLGWKRIVDSLNYLPENSFEAAAMKIDNDQFIYPTQYLSADIQTKAMIPRLGQNRNSFEYVAVKNRFDYIVFSRRSEAFTNIVKDSYLNYTSFYKRKEQQFKVERKYLLKSAN